MKKILLGILGLALVSSPAFAKGNPHGSNKDHGKSQDRDDKKHDRDFNRDKHHDKGHDRGDHHTASSRPAGWDKGKKTGWGNCDVPPGQAKKQGCHSTGTHRVVTHRTTTTHNPKSTATRPYPRRTTSTTTTTTTTTASKKGTHPFDPTLRRKQAELQDQRK